MKPRSSWPAWLVFAAALLLAVPLSLWAFGSLDLSKLPWSSPAESPPSDPVAATLHPLPEPPAAAVAALESGDCSEALRLLEGALPTDTHAGPGPALLAGLYAHACERPERARFTFLQAAEGWGEPGGAQDGALLERSWGLEDWRLFLLADNASALGDHATARAALDQLLRKIPDSPLRQRAFVRGVEVAARAGDRAAVARRVAEARAALPPTLHRDLRARLETEAWSFGREQGLARLAAEAGRHLTVLAPEQAEALGVEEALFGPEATPDWCAYLGAESCVERARSLLRIGRPGAATKLLRAVPLGYQDTSWLLLLAEALIADQRGLEAVDVLEGPGAAGHRAARAEEVGTWEWTLARAKQEAVRVRRGRPAAPAERREVLRREARAHLVRAGGQTGDPDIAQRALRGLFVELAEDDRFDGSLTVLRHLQQLDPRDRTGARHLFERGWAQFRRQDYTGAIGYWVELVELYPQSFDARRALYWSARSHALLGRSERAEELYQRVLAVDTRDFYHRYAAPRLRGQPPDQPAPAPVETWPTDSRLLRAELLASWGLGDLALSEIEARRGGEPGSARGGVDPRAASALEARILAARGAHRDSILALLATFDHLGSAQQGGLPEEALRLYYPLRFGDEIRRAATAESLPPEVITGMIRQESAFDQVATSSAGARGLMQLMPATGEEVARKLGLPFTRGSLAQPELNVRVGTAYFRQVMDLFDGRLELALAGYNGGPYRIRRLWRDAKTREMDFFIEDLPISESKSYVRRVILLADSYRQLYPDLAEGPTVVEGSRIEFGP